jgi:FtsP/CotA-like multicopper oxidase with cupredoxin domain
MRLPPLALAVSLALAGLAGCARDAAAPPLAQVHDNRAPAGTLAGDTLRLDLEVRAAVWAPEGDSGPRLPVHLFAEAGEAPSVPGPLIRVPTGTTLDVTLTNRLTDSTVVLHGVGTRPGDAADSIVLAPGARVERCFAAGAPGTYHYWGSTTGRDIESREWLDSQLHGAFIVDSAGAAPADRVFVMGIWSHLADSPPRAGPDTGEVMVINGRAWPHTERLTVPMGDTVTWRWVNPSGSAHPMHLHGVYFELASRGDEWQDTLYPPSARPLEATELMLPGGTMTMRWAPREPGNWVFHCHFAFHVSPGVSMDRHTAHTGSHRMAGLVLGIEATGGPPAADGASPRQLRLLLQERAGRVQGGPGYGFVLDQGPAPAPDSVEIPGPTLTLVRGEPVAITVVNHLRQPAAVHWHGIELQSYPDGVPDISGVPPRLFRPIAPGDSFTARFTPPRAGTFIYHSHFDESEQMVRGLYGALLVLEPGERRDPRTDHLIIVGGNGPAPFPDSIRSLVNGRETPAPIRLRPGRTHRLRLISIDVDRRIRFSLRSDSTVLRWRPVAKDGADLPPALRQERRAELLTGPGETADFLVTPASGAPLALQIEAPYVDLPWALTLPFEVR